MIYKGVHFHNFYGPYEASLRKHVRQWLVNRAMRISIWLDIWVRQNNDSHYGKGTYIGWAVLDKHGAIQAVVKDAHAFIDSKEGEKLCTK